MRPILSLLFLIAANCVADEKIRWVTMEQLALEQKAANKAIAAEIASMIPKAKYIELVSLQPGEPITHKGEPAAQSKRYGFILLGTAVSRNLEEAKALAASIHDGIIESNGEESMCFDPRHALRFPDGDDYVDIVLCFECAKGYVQRKMHQQWFTITKTPQPKFDAIFSSYGLKKAPSADQTTDAEK